MKAAARIIASPAFRLLAGLGLGGLALWLALRDVDLAALAGIWQRLDKPLAAAALLAALFSNLGKAMRWRLLLAAGDSDPGTWRTMRLFFSGQLANLALPGRLGDLARAYGAGGRGVGTTFALGTVIIEKGLDLLMFSLFVAALLLTVPLPEWMSRSAYALLGVAVLLALAFGWLVVKWESVSGVTQRLVERLPDRFRERARAHTAAALASLQGLRRLGELRQLIFLSIWIWIHSLLVNYLGLLSFNLALPVAASLLLLVALRLGISAALTPAAIGVFEFLCVLSLAVFEVSPVNAFGFGVFLHAVVLLPHLVLGGGAMISLSLPGGRPAGHLPE